MCGLVIMGHGVPGYVISSSWGTVSRDLWFSHHGVTGEGPGMCGFLSSPGLGPLLLGHEISCVSLSIRAGDMGSAARSGSGSPPTYVCVPRAYPAASAAHSGL